MRRFKIASLSMLALMLLCLPFAGQAGKDKASDNIYISSTEEINSSIYKAGNSVIIEGTVNGDVFVTGNIIKITGPINGSIFVVGNNITISSNVDGSVFVAGNNINISGTISGSIKGASNNISIDAVVKKNIMGVGSNVSLKDNSSVGWDVLLAGATISTDGIIGRNAEFYGESITLNSNIAGNVIAEIGNEGSLAILKDANIAGNLNYKAGEENQIDINDKATVSGETTFSLIEKTSQKPVKIEWQKLFFFFSFIKLISLFGVIVVGLVLIYISKTIINKNVSNMLENVMPSIGWGLIIFFITPLLVIFLVITVIGLPLAFMLLPIYFISIYLAKVMAAFAIGNKIIAMASKNKNKPGLIWNLVIGAVIITFIISIPIIGWVAKLFIIWWGLGSLMIVKKELLKIINK